MPLRVLTGHKKTENFNPGNSPFRKGVGIYEIFFVFSA